MLYCTGLAKLFVLELGPLLTALLLAGRIGGSFAGEVGTMEATNQNRLLKNLGISTRLWSLAPTVIAALIAAPVVFFVSKIVKKHTMILLFKPRTTDTWVVGVVGSVPAQPRQRSGALPPEL